MLRGNGRARSCRRLLAAAAAIAAVSLLSGCISIQIPGFGRHELTEKVVYGTEGPKILLIDLSGFLSDAAQERPLGLGQRESTVARVREELDRAAKDPEVRAVVLRINSPGGSVSASEILYREILRFKKKKHVPVVAEILGTGASGAYYVAMAADTVLAYPTSITGSIGVILPSVSFAGLMKKLGIENQTLTSGPYKDASSPLREMTPAQRKQLESVVDDLYARFLHVVEAGRPKLDAAAVHRLADGRIYSAKQALADGLIDGITDLPGAVEEAQRRAGISHSRVIVYHRPGEWVENLFSAEAARPPVSATSWLDAFAPGSFLYVWPAALGD